MKYTKELINELAKKHNTTVTGLAKIVGVCLSTLYRYCTWDDSAIHSKKALTQKKKFDKVMEKLINKEKEMPHKQENNEKYLRVNIESAEELCYQLSQGVEVFQEKSNDSLKLVDGLIVKFRGNNPVFINCAISLDGKYYIKVPKPIKVEIGKKYLTRDKKEAIVVSKDEEYFKSVIIGDGLSSVVDSTGKNINSYCEYDLVEEVDD